MLSYIATQDYQLTLYTNDDQFHFTFKNTYGIVKSIVLEREHENGIWKTYKNFHYYEKKQLAFGIVGHRNSVTTPADCSNWKSRNKTEKTRQTKCKFLKKYRLKITNDC